MGTCLFEYMSHKTIVLNNHKKSNTLLDVILQVKRRSWLIIRPKAIKSKGNLFCY